MEYLKVIEHNKPSSSAEELYFEFTSNHRIVRKIVLSDNGKLIGFAQQGCSWGTTTLCHEDLRHLSQEHKQDYTYETLNKIDFEYLWNTTVNRGSLPDLKTAENLYPRVVDLLQSYEDLVDNQGDEHDIAYQKLKQDLHELTGKQMDDYQIYETWEGEGLEVASFRIALPDPRKIEAISSVDLKNILLQLDRLKCYDTPWEQQSFAQKFEIYLDNFYHELLKINFQRYDYQSLFSKQSSGVWLTNEQICQRLLKD